ncbi:hypothetical protein ACFUAE_28240, partial [Streptomyces ardesiacus]
MRGVRDPLRASAGCGERPPPAADDRADPAPAVRADPAVPAGIGAGGRRAARGAVGDHAVGAAP